MAIAQLTPQQLDVARLALVILADTNAASAGAASDAYDAPDPATQVMRDAAAALRARYALAQQNITAGETTLVAMGL